MKIKILLTIIFVSLFWQIKAQEYLHLFEPNKKWHTVSYFEGLHTKTFVVSYEEQCILNGKTYNSIISTEEDGQPGSTLYMLAREDTVAKKVYSIYNCTDEDASEEQLIYDFSLEENDNVLVNEHYNTILYVDSIRIIDYFGVERKTFFFTSTSSNGWISYPVWVEGIGSLAGPTIVADTPQLYGLGE